MYDERGVGHSNSGTTSEWIYRAERRPTDKPDSSKLTPDPLADHPAVLSYREDGVQTDDLASFIESFASLRASRIKKIGHDQYAHASGQKFESFSVQDTVRELVEELADAGNYIDFLAIKLLNLVSTIEQTGLYCE